ncbi:MAG: MFS transporter [Planctomycetota bacterium]|nr:MFS transporter [Planctomycetota bacterium]
MDPSPSNAETQTGHSDEGPSLKGKEAENSGRRGSGTDSLDGVETAGTSLFAQSGPARRNFFVLAAYQITMRIGWIFKTESIVMPAIMDLLCGPGTALASWMRSWLPQLNRLGQSLPQLFFADRIRSASHKKNVVAICSGLMGLFFLGLAAIWLLKDRLPGSVMRVGFLLLYALFFIGVGVNNLGFNTLQGKLVAYDYRGRLFLVANTIGGILAIGAAWFLLRQWFSLEGGNLVWVFGFSGVCFLIGSAGILLCCETKDRHGTPRFKGLNFLRLPLTLFRSNTQFRLLSVIAACFGMSLVLFPHYQALYRECLAESGTGFFFEDLVAWVILQNAGTVVFSILAGPAADRMGNRFVLQFVLFLLASVPLLAICFSMDQRLAMNWYFVVFLILGVTPVTIRVLNNFALELAPPESHPQFLSALSLCIALPVIICSQIAGWAIPVFGFSSVFLVISAAILMGWVFTFFVNDPRFQLTTDVESSDN